MEIADKVSLKPTQTSKGERRLEPSSMTTTQGQGFEILANVVWNEIGRAIIDDLGGIVFAAGRPNEFRKVCKCTSERDWHINDEFKSRTTS